MPFKISRSSSPIFLPTLNPLLPSLCCKFVIHSCSKRHVHDAACPKEGKRKNDGFRFGVQDFPFWGRSGIAGSFGFRISTFGYEATYCARLRVAAVVARTILSDSRCYGYVLSLLKAIFISHIHEKSVIGFCEELHEEIIC